MLNDEKEKSTMENACKNIKVIMKVLTLKENNFHIFCFIFSIKRDMNEVSYIKGNEVSYIY